MKPNLRYRFCAAELPARTSKNSRHALPAVRRVGGDEVEFGFAAHALPDDEARRLPAAFGNQDGGKTFVQRGAELVFRPRRRVAPAVGGGKAGAIGGGGGADNHGAAFRSACSLAVRAILSRT